MGKIISFISGSKGGVGKSATAVNLAGAYAQRGYKVALVDCDTGSKKLGTRGTTSSDNWIHYRSDLIDQGYDYPKIMGYMKSPDDRIHSELSDLAKIYDVVIVDTPGAGTVGVRSTVAVSNIVLLPMNCTPVEFRPLRTFFEMQIELEEGIQTVNPDFQMDVRLLPTRKHHQRRLAKDTFMEWYAEGINELASLSAVNIPDNARIPESLSYGWSLSDIKDPKRAVFEILIDELEGKRSLQITRGSLHEEGQE